METTTTYDTSAWRQHRDAKLREWVGNAQATDFLLTYGHIAEVWDDLIDNDKPVSPQDINRAFLAAMVALPCNEFFITHRHQIMPLFVSGINAWMDANVIERLGDEAKYPFSYVLRDWYMELVNLVIYITRGWDYLRSVSLDVREFFTHHETLEQYKEKLK